MSVYQTAGRLFKRLDPSSQATWALRTFGVTYVPMIGFVWPSVHTLSYGISRVVIPFKRRNRNHVNSLYLGALTVGADLAAGSMAEYSIRDGDMFGSRKPIQILFKDMEAKFVSKATRSVLFTCNDKDLSVHETVKRLSEQKGASENITVNVHAQEDARTVALFKMTLNLKNTEEPDSEEV